MSKKERAQAAKDCVNLCITLLQNQSPVCSSLHAGPSSPDSRLPILGALKYVLQDVRTIFASADIGRGPALWIQALLLSWHWASHRTPTAISLLIPTSGPISESLLPPILLPHIQLLMLPLTSFLYYLYINQLSQLQLLLILFLLSFILETQ